MLFGPVIVTLMPRHHEPALVKYKWEKTVLVLVLKLAVFLSFGNCHVDVSIRGESPIFTDSIDSPDILDHLDFRSGDKTLTDLLFEFFQDLSGIASLTSSRKGPITSFPLTLSRSFSITSHRHSILIIFTQLDKPLPKIRECFQLFLVFVSGVDQPTQAPIFFTTVHVQHPKRGEVVPHEGASSLLNTSGHSPPPRCGRA